MQISKEDNNVEMVCRVKNMDPESLSLFHFHENYELCQPLNCACDFLVEGIPIHGEPGDILAVDSQAVHRFLPRFPESRIRVLQFSVGILPPEGALPLRTHITRGELEAVPGLFSTVNGMMDQMQEEPWVYRGEKNPLLKSMMVSLYLLLLKHFPGEKPTGGRKNTELFLRAVEYSRAHFADEHCTVENMARQLGISRERLAELFRRFTGLTPKQYLNTLRIDYVNQLLLKDSDITGAAFQAGFGSIRAFNGAYKAAMGMTPTEYLRNRNVKGDRS